MSWAAENGVDSTAQGAVDASRCFNPIPKHFHIALQVAIHVCLVELLLRVDGIDPNFWGGEDHGEIIEMFFAVDNIGPVFTGRITR